MTPEAVIHAIRALSRLDDTGRWNEAVRRVVVAKHAILSHESRSSMTTPPSRRLGENAPRYAISSQGEITSQEVMPPEQEPPAKRALPASEESREAEDSGQSALFAKAEELTEKVNALPARTNSKKEAAESESTEK